MVPGDPIVYCCIMLRLVNHPARTSATMGKGENSSQPGDTGATGDTGADFPRRYQVLNTRTNYRKIRLKL